MYILNALFTPGCYSGTESRTSQASGFGVFYCHNQPEKCEEYPQLKYPKTFCLLFGYKK